MASLNKVMLIGRLGMDPEIRYTQSNQAVVKLRLATDESYMDKQGQKVEQTEWHTVVVWGRQAELCANYLHKGSLAYVEGSLQTRKWQAQDGSDRYTTEIKASRVQFLETRNSQGQGDQPQQQSQAPQQGRQQPQGQRSQAQQNRQQPPRQQQPRQNGGAPRQQQPSQPGYDDLGPAFPSEASGMDDVPF